MKIPSTRSETLVAYARLLLVLVAAVAMAVDPSGPSSLAGLRNAIFAIYGLYACAAAIAASWPFAHAFRWMRATHVIDFIAVTLLVALTNGPNSPLFLFFVFLMFCSTVRFGRRETAWTAAATIVVYAAMGIIFHRIEGAPPVELNRFIVRLAYVAAIAALLMYLDLQYEGAGQAVVRPRIRLPLRRARHANDHEAILGRIRESAAIAERSRLAQDIHDGVLQSMAAVSLQLRRLGTLVGRDPEAARDLATKLEDIVTAAQRDLRLVLRNEPRPGRTSLQSGVVSQFEEFRDLGVDIDLRVGDVPQMPPESRQQIQKMIREAVANAAKHAAASRVKVEIGSDDAAVRLTITDDGRGFPVAGTYTLDELLASNSGPKALTRRVAELGGSLTLETSSLGTRLDFRLPLKTAS